MQKKLTRIRPPRVQISYDLQVGDAIKLRELPCAFGLMGDFNGHPTEPLFRLKDRRFVDVNPDNFDSLLESDKLEKRRSEMDGKPSQDGVESKMKGEENE